MHPGRAGYAGRLRSVVRRRGSTGGKPSRNAVGPRGLLAHQGRRPARRRTDRTPARGWRRHAHRDRTGSGPRPAYGCGGAHRAVRKASGGVARARRGPRRPEPGPTRRRRRARRPAGAPRGRHSGTRRGAGRAGRRAFRKNRGDGATAGPRDADRAGTRSAGALRR